MAEGLSSWTYAFEKKLAIDPGLVVFLDANACVVTAQAASLTVVVSSHNVTIPMSAKHITILTTATEQFGELAKQSLSAVVSAKLKELYHQVTGEPFKSKAKKIFVKKLPPLTEDEVATVTLPGGAAIPQPQAGVKVKMVNPLAHNLKNDLPPVVAQVVAGWECVHPDQMKSALPVKLRDATKMYQPVLGTSPGSRYYVVAGFQGLMVAARYADPKLSIRVEGDQYQNTKAALKATGFTISDTYASLHLECGNDEIARRALGAVLMGTGLPFSSPVPLFSHLKGK